MNLSSEQLSTLDSIKSWIASSNKPIGVLTGSAGTGKTTLLKSLVEHLDGLKKTYSLLAPTGRAARILSKRTSRETSTIHSAIYEIDDIKFEEALESDQSEFSTAGFNIPFKLKDSVNSLSSVFIVDESSMVSDSYSENETLSFGSGKLLHDLLFFAKILHKKNPKTKILFVGDKAQLPPINGLNNNSISPALSSKYFLGQYKIDTELFTLQKVMRQSESSLILKNAQLLRESIANKDASQLNIIEDDENIKTISSLESIKLITNNSEPETHIIITVSNQEAMICNKAIRNKLFKRGGEIEIQEGDILLVTKNSGSFFNGDLVKVIAKSTSSEKRSTKIAGLNKTIEISYRDLTVCPIELQEPKYYKNCKVVENMLFNASPTLETKEVRAILVDFFMRNSHLPSKSNEFKLALRDDPYFNALWVKFGYAITCHKAQGGEWDNVTVDFDKKSQNISYFRWVYTAITRAKQKLYLVNPPAWGGKYPPMLKNNELTLEQAKSILGDFANNLNKINDLTQSVTKVDKQVLEAVNLLIKSHTQPFQVSDSESSSIGKPWSKAEEDKLLLDFESGLSIGELAKNHGRTKGAITSRLARLEELRHKTLGKHLLSQSNVVPHMISEAEDFKNKSQHLSSESILLEMIADSLTYSQTQEDCSQYIDEINSLLVEMPNLNEHLSNEANRALKALKELRKNLHSSDEFKINKEQEDLVKKLQSSAPRCHIHHLKMILRQSEHGYFWSCPNFSLSGNEKCFTKLNLSKEETNLLYGNIKHNCNPKG